MGGWKDEGPANEVLDKAKGVLRQVGASIDMQAAFVPGEQKERLRHHPFGPREVPQHKRDVCSSDQVHQSNQGHQASIWGQGRQRQEQGSLACHPSATRTKAQSQVPREKQKKNGARDGKEHQITGVERCG